MALSSLILLSLPLNILGKSIPRQVPGADDTCTITRVLPQTVITSIAPLQTFFLPNQQGPNAALPSSGSTNGPEGPGGPGGESGNLPGSVNGPNIPSGEGGLRGHPGSAGGPGSVNGPDGLGSGPESGGPWGGSWGSGPEGPWGVAPWARGGPGGYPGTAPPYTTVYPITVDYFGPNGLEQRTYLATELCPTWPCHPSTGCPNGFTTSAATCTACGPKPTTAVLTVPCEGTPAVAITAYERVYDYFCPTGLASSTYSITQTCPETGACQTPAPDVVPPAFTAVKSVCASACGPSPVTATLTVPINSGTGLPNPMSCAGANCGPATTAPTVYYAGAPAGSHAAFGLLATVVFVPLLFAMLL
ncbi:uncharacterized protein E0L32_001101 [Thyridium curvatum]|uniref:Uncharacterized protein n=1 Tax=Thyridium curvatum TaxID=1093900 RepID=A0A507AU68_9PEZI|nr:uncharacterized protein E0L32_001101 [Thyridium curvatum]TPX11283.1 hypothetical protein E0L32_001101 [Thyridium curvatum]